VSAIPSYRGDSEVVADLVAPARVAKAANTLVAAVLGSDPHQADGQRVILLSGGEAEAESEVVALFEDAGSSSLTSAACARAVRCSRSVLRLRGSDGRAVRTRPHRARGRRDQTVRLRHCSHTSDDFPSIPNPPSNGGNRQ
jgi:hypothetical protein